MRMFLVLLGVPAAIMLFIYFAGSSAPANDEKSRARAAIDLCWEEYERKSLDPPTKRFVAGACERMERDFMAKFKHKP